MAEPLYMTASKIQVCQFLHILTSIGIVAIFNFIRLIGV